MEDNVGIGGRIANILTLAIILMAVLAAVGIGVVFFAPDLIPQPPTPTATATPPPPTIAQAAVVPTLTPTPTEDPLKPTFTPPPTNTPPPPTATNTRQPTLTPSITPTFPPSTPTRTPTNTPSPTPSPGPSPTPTFTLSPFPFNKTPDSPLYLRNYANTAGCDWLGLAGEVLDTNGNPVAAGEYQVRVWDSGIDERVSVGPNDYSPAGWEQFVFDRPAVRDYNIQLETRSGTPVSQVYRVQTRASCNENLLYFIFTQNR